jgi:putative selenate reductase
MALDLLKRVRWGEEVDLGERVLVIGGGNTAMDAARTARRLAGGAVTVVYRRTRREMPATDEEIEGLFAEGGVLEELASPVRILLQEGRVAGLECIRNELGEPGADGRRRPVPIEGSEFEIAADSVIVAIGQRADVSFLDGSSITLRKNGTIVVDPQTGLAGEARVYAGGDAVRGPAIIIEACADGRRAAEAILEQLGVGDGRPAVQLPALSAEEIVRAKAARARKTAQHRGALLPPERRSGFDLVEATLMEDAALGEAARCMQCSSFCDKCVEVCPNRANYTFTIAPVSVMLPRVSCQQGGWTVVGEEPFQVAQARQIVHVDDFCNECGNCATFCVHQGEPYRDKPRLYLQESDFQQETDNAFYIEERDGGWMIQRREGGETARLYVADATGAMDFEDDRVRASLSPDFQIETLELKGDFEGTLSLRCATEMTVMLKGITSSLPFLLI